MAMMPSRRLRRTSVSNVYAFPILYSNFILLTISQPVALWTNATTSIGIPTWRYYFNASFSNTQAFPQLGAYHASEIPLVFRTYNASNTTTQEYALSLFMQGAWARFAKNPLAGPGWNAVGTGRAGSVLSGAYDQVVDGLYYSGGGNVTIGDWNLGVLGDVGNARSGAVTVLPQSKLDFRCDLYKPIYQAVVGRDGMPSLLR